MSRPSGFAPSGFTLVELMIVLVIAGIISAFAIPNLMESRKAGNETSAEKALKTLVDAQAGFMQSDPDNNGKDFAPTLAALHDQTDAVGNEIALIPASLASGTREGYTYGPLADYDTNPIPGTDPRYGFAYFAIPTAYGTTGRRSYIVNQTGAIFYKDLGTTVLTTADTWSALDPAGSGSGWILLGE